MKTHPYSSSPHGKWPFVLWLRSLGWLVLLVALTGCADLAGIRKFSALSVEAADYTEIVRDYAASAQREVRHAPSAVAQSGQANRRTREAQEAALLKMHGVVGEYMETLGRLAADDLVAFDREAAGLSTGLRQIGAVDAAQAQAAQSLVALVGKAAADGYRRAKLREIIFQANPDFQIVLRCLKTFVTADYVSALAGERASLRTAYGGILEVPDHPQSEDVAVLLIREKYYDRLEAVDRREKAAVTYGKVLEKIAAAHEDLFQNRANLSSRQVWRDMQGYSAQLQALLRDLPAAKTD